MDKKNDSTTCLVLKNVSKHFDGLSVVREVGIREKFYDEGE
jgi:hypothetical protein